MFDTQRVLKKVFRRTLDPAASPQQSGAKGIAWRARSAKTRTKINDVDIEPLENDGAGIQDDDSK